MTNWTKSIKLSVYSTLWRTNDNVIVTPKKRAEAYKSKDLNSYD